MSLQEVQLGGAPRLNSAPEGLRPERANAVLPAASAEDLRLLRWQGWRRFGIVAAVLDDDQRLLMLSHRASSKNTAGALGPLAETAQLARTPSGIVVESTQDTLARSLREELGIVDPTSVDMHARPIGSWELYSWPVGAGYGDQQAFAVCPVLRVSNEQGERLEDGFSGTSEISSVQFMTLDQIERNHNVRPGTEGWLGTIATSPLFDTPLEAGVPLVLPNGASLPGAVDARLLEMQL